MEFQRVEVPEAPQGEDHDPGPEPPPGVFEPLDHVGAAEEAFPRPARYHTMAMIYTCSPELVE